MGATFSLTIDPFFRKIFLIPGGQTLFNFSTFIIEHLWGLFVITRVVTFSKDASKIPSDRGLVLFEEALVRGWKMEIATIFGRGVDTYRISLPSGKTIVFNGLPKEILENSNAPEWIDDKALLKRRLREAGAPVSRGESFRNVEEAEKFRRTLECPIIVKPRFGSRGRHTTTFLTDSDDFKKAFKIAQQLGSEVIVEEHLVGSVYRGTMIDGKLVGVLAGDPPRITGDGVHTIKELIEIKNNNRHARVGAFKISPMTPLFLKRRGYMLDAILEKATTIDLSEKIGLSYGGNAREVTPLTHPKLKIALEHAAHVVNDPVIGFDFISTDISADPSSVVWGIIECNAVPFINLHHDPLEGEPVNAAGALLDYVERIHYQKTGF